MAWRMVQTASVLLAVAAVALVHGSARRSVIPGDGRVLQVSNGTEILFSQMTAELATAQAVFIGELHDVRDHHRIQLEVIRALHEADVPVAIGLEMFRAEHQRGLDSWVTSAMSERTFRGFYEENWTLPWELYADIFLYARDHGLPLLGLNVPDAVTGKVARSGFASLNSEELRQLPRGIACDVDDAYMEFIRRSHGSPAHQRGSFRFFCEAQMLWDGVMAKRIADYLEQNLSRTVVVLAGGGHAWRRGIPARLAAYAPKVRSVVVMPSIPGRSDPATVTTDDADFVVL